MPDVEGDRPQKKKRPRKFIRKCWGVPIKNTIILILFADTFYLNALVVNITNLKAALSSHTSFRSLISKEKKRESKDKLTDSRLDKKAANWISWIWC